MDPKGLQKIQEKAPDKHLVPAVTKRPRRRGGAKLRASTPPRPGPASHRCTDRPRPHAAGPGSTTPAWGSGATVGKRPRGEDGPQPDPRRARVAGSPEERMLGAGPRWGRGPLPGLSLTASISSRAGLRGGTRSGSQPRVSPPEAQRPAGTRGAVEKSARAKGVQRAELRGWEGWDGRAHRCRRGDTTDTASAGSSQPRKLRALLPHPPPASRPPHHATPAGGVTAVLTNQRPRGGREPRTKRRAGTRGLQGRRAWRRDFL